MSEFEVTLFLILAVYIPITLFVLGIVLLIIGIYLKSKKLLVYKKLFIIGGICLAVFLIIFLVIPFTMGLIGVGPGLSD